jgi:hypothetical protein
MNIGNKKLKLISMIPFKRKGREYVTAVSDRVLYLNPKYSVNRRKSTVKNIKSFFIRRDSFTAFVF